MKQLKIIVLFALMIVGGFGCDEGIPPGAIIDPCGESYYYYLEIENLTGQTAQIEFHEVDIGKSPDNFLIPLGGEFFFNLHPGEVKTVFRGIGPYAVNGIRKSPLPKDPKGALGTYDSMVVVVGDRRDVFFWIFSCRPSPSCTAPTRTGASPGWESTWNPFIEGNWKRVQRPRPACSPSPHSGAVYRFFLRPK